MPNQLRMVWTSEEYTPEISLPEGYKLRRFREGDEEDYIRILNMSDLGKWNLERLKRNILSNLLSPEGIYFAVYDDVPVATAAAFDRTSDDDRQNNILRGELGWVASDPQHRGKGLGLSVCGAVVNHLLGLGYDHIYLSTDHWRLPAIKTYLKLGFESQRDTPDARFMWAKLSEKLNWPLGEPKKARYVQKPKGAEIAWQTLNKEHVSEPCIIASWCMKRKFFQSLTHRENIYEDAPNVVIEAFIRAGANLCPQFIMPSPNTEHIACNPFSVANMHKSNSKPAQKPSPKRPKSPEDVRNLIEDLPAPDTLERDFDVEVHADNYARNVKKLNDMARGEMLFISGFGQADFMGGYSRWGYENFLGALALYPEHLERYFAYTGEKGRLRNIAIARAVEKHGIAPFVYGGQDICYNHGPICSIETLDRLYFPNLARAVEPLHEAEIGIIWHCDGDIRPIINQLINVVGVAGFQGFQEETGCTLEHIASHSTHEGEKLLLWGSVSVTTTLPFGTVDDVKKDVERCFRVAADAGGFALASTSSILPETPLENILALFDHGRRFGREYLK